MMTYTEFIDKINKGEITKILFYVKNYNHYRNCSIRCYNDEFTFLGREISLPTIEVKLTADKSEITRFHKTFEEECKLFKINRKKYTLKEVWDRIQIIDITELSD